MNLRDPVFKGCTRPAMVMGIPFTPFVVVSAAVTLAGCAGSLTVGPGSFPASLAVLLVLLQVLREIAKRDDQRLHQLWLRIRLFQRTSKAFGAGMLTYGSYPAEPRA